MMFQFMWEDFHKIQASFMDAPYWKLNLPKRSLLQREPYARLYRIFQNSPSGVCNLGMAISKGS